MSRDYIDLSNQDNLKRWNNLIAKARKLHGTGFFRDYEEEFVGKMLQMDEDAGLWNPSLKQWNYLHTLVS